MQDVVSIAAQIAKTAHEGQYRLDAEKRPYIVHPALAADLVEKLVTKDKDVIAAAWLHDVIEDTDIKTEEALAAAFQQLGYSNATSIHRIAGLVQELSMPEGIEWKKVRSFQIDKIAEMSFDAKILKIADQVANYLDGMPAGWSETKIRNYSFKALDICSACADVAPYIYELFQIYRGGKESLSRNEVSRLVNKIAAEKEGRAPAQIQETQNLKAAIKSEKISMDVLGFYKDNAQKVLGVRVNIESKVDLADELRERVEEKGVFAKTLPVHGGTRDLVFSIPVEINFLKKIVGL